MESPWCNHNPETVCARHLNFDLGRVAGKGKGQKADDYAIFFGCQSCEYWYNAPENKRATIRIAGTDLQRDWYVLRAMIRTWRRLLDKGVLK